MSEVEEENGEVEKEGEEEEEEEKKKKEICTWLHPWPQKQWISESGRKEDDSVISSVLEAVGFCAAFPASDSDCRYFISSYPTHQIGSALPLPKPCLPFVKECGSRILSVGPLPQVNIVHPV